MSDLYGRLISPMVIQSALSISKKDRCMQLYSRSDPKKEVGIILFSKGVGGRGAARPPFWILFTMRMNLNFRGRGVHSSRTAHESLLIAR